MTILHFILCCNGFHFWFGVLWDRCPFDWWPSNRRPGLKWPCIGWSSKGWPYICRWPWDMLCDYELFHARVSALLVRIWRVDNMHIDPCEHECQGFIAGITQAVNYSTEELTSTVTVDTEHPKINTRCIKFRFYTQMLWQQNYALAFVPFISKSDRYHEIFASVIKLTSLTESHRNYKAGIGISLYQKSMRVHGNFWLMGVKHVNAKSLIFVLLIYWFQLEFNMNTLVILNDLLIPKHWHVSSNIK